MQEFVLNEFLNKNTSIYTFSIKIEFCPPIVSVYKHFIFNATHQPYYFKLVTVIRQIISQ